MTTLQLNIQFKNETDISCVNSQGEPDIDYVHWLESKIISANAPIEEIKKLRQKYIDAELKLWAKLMQIEIAKGKTVKECADEAKKGLGYLGITGFQYGCVVSALAHYWIHGEELRKWHNKEYGVSEDKEGVVNPAILTIR